MHKSGWAFHDILLPLDEMQIKVQLIYALQRPFPEKKNTHNKPRRFNKLKLANAFSSVNLFRNVSIEVQNTC